MRLLEIDQYVIGRYGDLLVLNKPYDWPTSGRSLDDPESVQYHVIRHFGTMVWAIHQLDADTTGLCFFSFSKSLVPQILSKWSDPAMSKEYLAIVYGEPSWDSCEERSPIGMVDERSLGVSSDGRSAHSVFDVMHRGCGYSVIRARIYTGRTHQIRIHLSHLGHPLVGEEWYRSEPCSLHPRQALHAYKVVFPISANLELDHFRAPLPDDMIQLAARLGLPLDHIKEC